MDSRTATRLRILLTRTFVFQTRRLQAAYDYKESELVTFTRSQDGHNDNNLGSSRAGCFWRMRITTAKPCICRLEVKNGAGIEGSVSLLPAYANPLTFSRKDFRQSLHSWWRRLVRKRESGYTASAKPHNKDQGGDHPCVNIYFWF